MKCTQSQAIATLRKVSELVYIIINTVFAPRSQKVLGVLDNIFPNDVEPIPQHPLFDFSHTIQTKVIAYKISRLSRLIRVGVCVRK